jgi:hypothetical protein
MRPLWCKHHTQLTPLSHTCLLLCLGLNPLPPLLLLTSTHRYRRRPLIHFAIPFLSFNSHFKTVHSLRFTFLRLFYSLFVFNLLSVRHTILQQQSNYRDTHFLPYIILFPARYSETFSTTLISTFDTSDLIDIYSSSLDTVFAAANTTLISSTAEQSTSGTRPKAKERKTWRNISWKIGHNHVRRYVPRRGGNQDVIFTVPNRVKFSQ